MPPDVLALLPGDGTVGQALVNDPRIAGVAFTGGTETAQAIARALAARPGPLVPLIAETGGINAMIVDSSALPEQVVTDVLASAFGSAGQRCSALRLLCLQEDIADRVLRMLRGAAETLADRRSAGSRHRCRAGDRRGRARRRWNAHAAAVGTPLFALPLPPAPSMAASSRRAPSCLRQAGELTAEIFGPVLCVVRYAADRLDDVLDAIEATGYGLTLGIHSRIESDCSGALPSDCASATPTSTATRSAPWSACSRSADAACPAPGPKAGGPITLYRFAEERVVSVNTAAAGGNAALLASDEA